MGQLFIWAALATGGYWVYKHYQTPANPTNTAPGAGQASGSPGVGTSLWDDLTHLAMELEGTNTAGVQPGPSDNGGVDPNQPSGAVPDLTGGGVDNSGAQLGEPGGTSNGTPAEPSPIDPSNIA